MSFLIVVSGGLFRNLMARQDMSELGFGKEDISEVTKEKNEDGRIKS